MPEGQLSSSVEGGGESLYYPFIKVVTTAIDLGFHIWEASSRLLIRCLTLYQDATGD